MVIGQYPTYLYLIDSFLQNEKKAVNKKTQAVDSRVLNVFSQTFNFSQKITKKSNFKRL